MGIGKVSIYENFSANNVSFVSGLGYNRLSVSQLCANNQHQVVFDSNGCQVIENNSCRILLKGICENNLYIVDSSYLKKVFFSN